MSWSNAILCRTGTVALCFVMGNVFVKNENQWNCTGDMMKPYDMNLVNRSKSNGGGP